MKIHKLMRREMWKYSWKYIILTVFVLPLVATAQVEDLKNSEEVMVIAPFNPTIAKANKLNFSPAMDTNTAQKLKIDYITQPKLFATNFSLEKLTAAKFIDKRAAKYAQNYVKVGFGMYMTPYAELIINNKLSNESVIGVHLRHMSTDGDIKDMAFSGHSLSSAKVWTKHIKRKQTTKLAIDYRRNQIHYYGFFPDDYPLDLAATNNNFQEDINQVYSHVGVNVDVDGNFDAKQRDWAVNLGYQYFWDHFNSQEHLVDIKAHLERSVDWINAKNQYAGIAFSTQSYYSTQNFSGQSPSLDSTTGYFHGLYDLVPYYHLSYGGVGVKIGAKVSMKLDSNTRVTVAPMVKLVVGLLEDQLNLYANVDGGFYNNSMASLVKENSFVSPMINIKYTHTKYLVQAGFKGHILSVLDYHVYAETAAFEDMPMFVTDTSARFDNSFTVIYDGGQKLGGGAELLFKTKDWNINLYAHYHSFTMDTASRAWQKPEFTYQLKISYDVLENLKVSGVLLGQSKMYAWYQGEKTVDPWMDFNMMIDYHLNKNLGVFLNINNIFSNEYQLWYGYPVQGFGVMGGLHFAF